MWGPLYENTNKVLVSQKSDFVIQQTSDDSLGLVRRNTVDPLALQTNGAGGRAKGPDKGVKIIEPDYMNILYIVYMYNVVWNWDTPQEMQLKTSRKSYVTIR